MSDFINTVTGVAEQYLGEVERYREILKENPQVLSYRLPPSAQASIDSISKLTGLKIPSVEQLNKPIANLDTQLNKALGGLYKDTQATIDKSGVESVAKEGVKLIKSLDWLL